MVTGGDNLIHHVGIVQGFGLPCVVAINRFGTDSPEELAAIKQIVLLKFKPTTAETLIEDSFQNLAGLTQLIPGIVEFMGGPYSSQEGLNQGYTHGFVMTFSSAEARDVYLPHPEHERVKSMIAPLVDSVVAFDFEV